MCYAIPGRLISLQGSVGTVDYYGELRKVYCDEDVAVGDFVYAQGGIVVRRVDEDEAQRIRDTWKDRFFGLKEKDGLLANSSTEGASECLLPILQRINQSKPLSYAQLKSLLSHEDPDDLRLIYDLANNIRHKRHGNASCVHGIIEFSNHCRRNCHYCGIRIDRDIDRYRMTAEEIVELARNATERLGFKALVVQSGEDLWYEEEVLVEIVKRLKQLGILVFLSIGDRSIELYERLYEAGARAALLRFETSNADIFRRLRPGTRLNDRLSLIRSLKDIGYVIATGFLVGLPDETPDDIINNILLTKSLEPEMFSFGPLIPTERTPLASTPLSSKDMLLKIIALCRFAEPDSNILVTTAFETLDADARKTGLLSGANSLMLNITPADYKRMYNIYQGRAGVDTDIRAAIDDTVRLLLDLGRAPTDVGIDL